MRINRGLLLLGVVVGFGAIGCGPDFQTVCEDSEKCYNGNDADIEACVALFEHEQDVADIRGCGDEFDVWFECYMDKATCDTQNNDYGLRNNSDCEAESNAYQHCT